MVIEKSITKPEALIAIQPDGPNFHLWYYEDGKKKYRYAIDFKPYFYGSFVDRGVFPKEIDVDKIFVKHPHDVKEERKKYPFQYSADILYFNRLLIDTYYKEPIPECNFRTAYIDIENLTNEKTKEFPVAHKAEFPMTAITIKDNWSKKLFTFAWHEKEQWMDFKNNIFVFKTEKELLANFVNFWKVMDFDVVTGWNINNYDIPYLHNRLKRFNYINSLSTIRQVEYDSHNGRYKISGLSVIDYLEHYDKRSLGEKESYKLNNVAEDELGHGKIDYEGSLGDLWRNDIHKYLDYNRRDVELVWELENGNGISGHKNEFGLKYIQIADGIRRVCRVIFDDVLTSTKLHDNAILCALKREGKIARSKIRMEDRKIAGAFVFEPKIGIHDWVTDLDATGLYPSIIIAQNISPEVSSPFDEKGIVPKVVEEYIKQRKVYKDKYKKTGNITDFSAQWAYKILANSLYGVIKNVGFRFHNPDMAEKITLTGQKILKFTHKKLTEKGYEPIYGDTDSTFLCLKNSTTVEEAKKECRELQNYINGCMPEIEKELGVPNGNLHFKQEIIARRGLFLQSSSGKATKKRYVLWVVNEEGRDVDEMKFVGVESVRSDTPKVVRTFLKKFYTMILKERKSISELRKFVEDFKKEIPTLPVDDIGLPMGITKPLEEYSGNSIHVAGINYWNKHYLPKISGSIKIKYYYIRGAESHVISVPDGEKFPKELNVDYPKMIERLVDMKVEKVFDIIQPKVTLMDF